MLTSLTLALALTGSPAQIDTASAATAAAVPAAPSALEAKKGGKSKDTIEPALVRTQDKLDLRGDYFPPRTKSSRAPAALLLHDAGGDRSEVIAMAESLQKAGFGVLALDLRGHGESATEDRDWEKLEETDRETLWAFATRDVDAGARWLSSRDGLHSTNLTVIGVGAGGALAARHAIRDENVRGVGLVGLEKSPYGFDLPADLADLEGLPVTLVVAKEERKDAEALVEDLEGEDWITVSSMRSARESILKDKRLSKSVVKWAQSTAMPQRGGRG